LTLGWQAGLLAPVTKSTPDVLRDILDLIEENILVRNIEHDHDVPSFMRHGLRVLLVLKEAENLATPKVISDAKETKTQETN